MTVPHDPLGMDIEAYHAMPNVGSSFLKAFSRSPLHAWSAYLDPDRKPVDTAAFKFGRAWHCAVFEPGEFAARYVADHEANKNLRRAQVLAQVLAGDVALDTLVGIPDDLSKTTKAGKELYAEQEALGRVPVPMSERLWIALQVERIAGRTVLHADRIAEIGAMVGIVRALPISRVLFEQYGHIGLAETSILDQCPITGVPLKIRPDYLVPPCAAFPSGLVVDGKTTQDASRAGFARSAWNLDYGLQAALYTRVVQRVFGTKTPPAFVWLAQEKTRPFAAQPFAASDALLGYWSQRLDTELLPAVRQCLDSGAWPGYSTQVEPLEMPGWAERIMEGDDEGAEVTL